MLKYDAALPRHRNSILHFLVHETSCKIKKDGHKGPSQQVFLIFFKTNRLLAAGFAEFLEQINYFIN